MAVTRFRDLARALIAELRSRQAQGELSTTALAERTCFSQAHISNLLTGRRQLTITTADALMLGLRLTTEDLLRRALDRDVPDAPPPHVTSPAHGKHQPNLPRIHFHPPDQLDWPDPHE